MLDAYLDAMTYNWNSYFREGQLSTLMNTLTLTNDQFDIFDFYINRVSLMVSFIINSLMWIVSLRDFKFCISV